MGRRILIICTLLLTACSGRVSRSGADSGMEYARWFDLIPEGIVTISPSDNHRDTLIVSRPLDRLVCMSSSYLAYLDGISCDSVVVGVSGIGYVTDPSIRERYDSTRRGTAERPLYDIGYDADPDYERIVALRPDLLIAYSVSAAEPAWLSRLRDLGIPVLLLSEQLENHPLARAEYVRLFGALTGRREKADSVFTAIRDRYESLRVETDSPVPVLLNMPYADQWFVPGADNYMTRLVRDAGGEVLGSAPGTSASRIMSLEEAWMLAGEARAWLNPGWCRSREQLSDQLPSFSRFDIPVIYNNIRRSTDGGGNDFWESGALRADRVLDDLVRILRTAKENPRETVPGDSLYYFIPVE